MAQIRKTKQQKIQLSQRKETQRPAVSLEQADEAVLLSNGPVLAKLADSPLSTLDAQTQATYTYALDELKRISWITLLCLALLAIASLLLSQMPWFVEIRQMLSLPTFSL